MFTDLLTYSGIITKTKAMQANLISSQEFEAISNLSSVTEFINFLKVHPAYKDLFLQYDERTLHRTDIEQIIRNSLYLDFAKLYRFSNGKQREALTLIFFRYEINILKAFLQNIYIAESTYDLSLFEPFFTKHSSLDIRSLAGSQSLEEFISHLKGSRYFDLFQKIQHTTDSTLYDFESQLDIYYYISVWKLRKHLSKKKELFAFTDIIGKEIDFMNLIWIYRSKKYYEVESSKIYSSIIPIHYKLKANELMHLVDAGSPEEFLSIVDTTCYHTSKADAMDKHVSIETLFYEKLYQLNHLNMKKYPISMCSIHHFLFMKELEIDRLTTALECIRYGLSSPDALNYILR